MLFAYLQFTFHLYKPVDGGLGGGGDGVNNKYIDL